MRNLPPLAPEIAHLDPEEIETLYTRYLAGEKISVLQAEFRIPSTAKQLIYLFPPLILNEKLCPYCHCAMSSKRKNKTQRVSEESIIKCLDCGHFEDPQSGRFKKHCNCKPCQLKRKEAEARREIEFQKTIKDKFNPELVAPIPYTDLNFKHKLTLISLLRCQTPESFDYIIPITQSHRNYLLSPTANFTEQLLASLCKCKAIIIDPNSPPNSLRNKDPDIFNVQWLSNVTLDGQKRSTLTALYSAINKDLDGNISSSWSPQIKEMLFQIPQEEVIQYLHLKANILDVSFGAETKTPTIIKQLLETHSTSQLYTLASNAVDNAHLFYKKKHVSHRHAANTIPGKMLSLAEAHAIKKREVFEFSRDRNAPRSVISKIFFDFYLGDVDAAFKIAPGKYWRDVLSHRLPHNETTKRENNLFCPECGSLEHSLKMKDISIYLTCRDCEIISTFSLS